MLIERLGLPASIGALFAYVDERWDGKGPTKARGEEIPLAMRIAHVARDIDVQRVLGGAELAAAVVGERAGSALDPAIAARFVEEAEAILAIDDEVSVWDQTLACEPAPRFVLERGGIDRALSAMGDFTDLVCPFLAGHSAGVAKLASRAAEACRLDEDEVTAVRRAGLVHDLGRVAVPVPIWQKPGPLTTGEWERVRLHPYYTERVLSRSPFLAALAPVATAHHERLDGSGYHRGVRGGSLTPAARLLAAADAYQAMTEPRPHREALPPERAAEIDRRGGPRRAARRRRGRRGAGGGGAAGAADQASCGSDRARGRGGGAAGARSADQAGSACAGHLRQDRRPPRPERLPQDRRVDARRGRGVRDGARAHGMGRTPDWQPRRSLVASFHRHDERRIEETMNYQLAYRIGFHPWEDLAEHPPFATKLLELVAREEDGHAPPFGPALDLGCGSAVWGVRLAQRGWDVTGVDIVEKALRRARERVAEAGVEMRLVHGDVRALRERTSAQGSGWCWTPGHSTALRMPSARQWVAK